jgi:hypothetical protein
MSYLDTSAKRPNEGTLIYYGDADYARDRAAGVSASETLAKINADPSKMGDGGVGGNLYNRIAAEAAAEGSTGGSRTPAAQYTSPGTPASQTPAVRAEAAERARIYSDYDPETRTGANMLEMQDLSDLAESDWRLTQAMFAGENNPAYQGKQNFKNESGIQQYTQELDNRVASTSQYYKDKAAETFGRNFGDVYNNETADFRQPGEPEKVNIYGDSTLKFSK